MIHNWKEFNELMASTYRSASSKLKSKNHTMRGRKLDDYADEKDVEIIYKLNGVNVKTYFSHLKIIEGVENNHLLWIVYDNKHSNEIVTFTQKIINGFPKIETKIRYRKYANKIFKLIRTNNKINTMIKKSISVNDLYVSDGTSDEINDYM